MTTRFLSLLAGAAITVLAGPGWTAPAGTPAEVAEGAPTARTRTASRLRLAAAVLPPSRPDELRAPQPATPAFPFNPFAAFSQAAHTPAATAPATTAAIGDQPSTNPFGALFGGAPAQPRGAQLPAPAGRAEIDAMIAKHARLNHVPESLVHRVVRRESNYNPRAVGSGGAMGLMQIKTATARALGYQGGPAGLLDAETNLTYAVKYLAGAYRTADGNHDHAVSHYARGYYYAAKRKGTLVQADATPAEAAPTTPIASLFDAFKVR